MTDLAERPTTLEPDERAELLARIRMLEEDLEWARAKRRVRIHVGRAEQAPGPGRSRRYKS